MMNDQQLTRLRLVESELLLMRSQLQTLTVLVFELHGLTVEMLNAELAAPLVRE